MAAAADRAGGAAGRGRPCGRRRRRRRLHGLLDRALRQGARAVGRPSVSSRGASPATAASGRNAGIVGEALDHSHELAIRHFGLDEARELARIGRENLDELERFVAERKIDADFRRPGQLTVALTDAHVEALEASARAGRASRRVGMADALRARRPAPRSRARSIAARCSRRATPSSIRSASSRDCARRRGAPACRVFGADAGDDDPRRRGPRPRRRRRPARPGAAGRPRDERVFAPALPARSRNGSFRCTTTSWSAGR